jgi:V/A-type H+-transporting ATPase subunit E
MSEAQGKADIIMQDANSEIAAINANAEKTAEAEKTKILENGKKQSEMRYQQIISEAKMNARRAELGAKEEVIEAAFNKATDELQSIASSGSEEYDDALTRMIKEAADEIGGKNLVLQMNEKDTKKFKDQLESSGVSTFQIEDITFELGEPIETMGGAILKTSNGDIEVNNTIESRLDRFKSVLRSEVANVLFK